MHKKDCFLFEDSNTSYHMLCLGLTCLNRSWKELDRKKQPCFNSILSVLVESEFQSLFFCKAYEFLLSLCLSLSHSWMANFLHLDMLYPGIYWGSWELKGFENEIDRLVTGFQGNWDPMDSLCLRDQRRFSGFVLCLWVR